MKTSPDNLFFVKETRVATSTAKGPWSRPTLTKEKPHTLMNGFFRWAMPVLLFFFMAVRPDIPMAQTLPIMVIDDASVFEGTSGTKILAIPVRFVGSQPNAVTGVVSAIPLPGTGFNPATGGSACGGSVDFIQFSNVPFSIPANTPNGTFTLPVTICGDTVIEPNEQIFVFLSNVVGADCSLEGTCNAVATIRNDDGTPQVRINDISTSTLSGLSKTTAFTVSLDHPSNSSTSVHFATRDGTAHAQTTTNIGAYRATSGTLTIPANTLSGTISVTITGFGGGTFFMDLSSPVNGNIVDGTGQATIKITTLTVGTFDVSPANAVLRSGDTVNYNVLWTVPDNEVWRDLKTIDFRFRQGNKVPFWVKWDEASNTFSACTRVGKKSNATPSQVICTAGEVPGSHTSLETEFGLLDLAESSVIGSGPTGRSVSLNLAIIPGTESRGHYELELAASDDFDNQDEFVGASELRVVPEQQPVGKSH